MALYQQINLYQPVSDPAKEPFRAWMLLQISGLVLILLLSSYAYSHWQLYHLGKEVARVEAQHARIAEEIALLGKLTAPQDTSALQRRIDQIDLDLAERRNLVNNLGGLLSKGAHGFAREFNALALQHIPGVWLTGVYLENETRTVELRGTTLEADLVPVYLKVLPQHEAFRNTEFLAVQLSRDGKNPQHVKFVLRTNALEDIL